MDRRIYFTPHGAYPFDPIDAWRKLVVGSKGEINQWLASHRSDDLLQSAEAEQKIITLVRDVFRLRPWTPEGDGSPAGGWTDGEVLETLDHFNRYLQGKG